MNRPIDQYTAAQLEADRAKVSALLASLAREDYAQSRPDPVGEWLCVPVMAAIALVGGLLLGLRL